MAKLIIEIKSSDIIKKERWNHIKTQILNSEIKTLNYVQAVRERQRADSFLITISFFWQCFSNDKDSVSSGLSYINVSFTGQCRKIKSKLKYKVGKCIFTTYLLLFYIILFKILAFWLSFRKYSFFTDYSLWKRRWVTGSNRIVESQNIPSW